MDHKSFAVHSVSSTAFNFKANAFLLINWCWKLPKIIFEISSRIKHKSRSTQIDASQSNRTFIVLNYRMSLSQETFFSPGKAMKSYPSKAFSMTWLQTSFFSFNQSFSHNCNTPHIHPYTWRNFHVRTFLSSELDETEMPERELFTVYTNTRGGYLRPPTHSQQMTYIVRSKVKNISSCVHQVIQPPHITFAAHRDALWMCAGVLLCRTRAERWCWSVSRFMLIFACFW